MIQASRPFKPELFYEMQKCLPLPKAVNILVNVPSSEIVLYNAPKILCNLRRLKTSLEEYIQTNSLPLYSEEEYDCYETEEGRVWINNDLEWKPEFYALLRYGYWGSLTSMSVRPFEMDGCNIVGIPENFVGELLLHFTNNFSSTEKMLQSVKMNFEKASFPTFLEQLDNKKEYQIGDRIFFEPIELRADDGRIFHIFDGELHQFASGSYYLDLFVMNKMDKSWSKIGMKVDDSMKFIRQLKFSRWDMQNDIVEFLTNDGYAEFKQIGDKLEAKTDVHCGDNLDLFLRRGAGFTQFQHFEVKRLEENEPYCLSTNEEYANFLVNYVSNTKYPEDFLESIDIRFGYDRTDDFIGEIWDICCEDEDIPAGGIFVEFDKGKLHILSAEIYDNYNFQFTLANGPTTGAYVFDVVVHFEYPCAFHEKISGIEIRKRKVEIIDLRKKRKASNDDGEEDEDGPTCSNKMMKT